MKLAFLRAFIWYQTMTIFQQLWTLTFYGKRTFDTYFRKRINFFVKSILNDWFRKKQTKSFGIVWARRIRSNLKRIFLVNAWKNRNALRLTFWPWIQSLAVIFRICTGSRFVCMHMMNISTNLQQCNAIFHNQGQNLPLSTPL